MRIPESKRDV